jgi:hypothetical protein
VSSEWHLADPDLAAGLRWWSPGTSAADIAGAVRQEPGFQLSLLDSWTLHAWSRWLARRSTGVDAVVLLHVDDHDDLMSPRIAATAEGWRDLVTGRCVELSRPDSVAAAILSGAVGPESFIAPLIHGVDRVHVRHLVAGGDDDCRRHRCSLRRVTCPDGRLSVLPSSAGGGSSYMSTESPERWLADLEEGAVLLHIDLDGLANAFDGSRATPAHVPGAAGLAAAVSGLFAALDMHDVVRRVEDTTVALSPGFFPAALWQAGVAAVREHVR